MTDPLNGTKTHPLSKAARHVLWQLTFGPMPLQEINPGVQNRFERHEVPLIEVVDLPSPYKSHKGRDIKHARITDAGRAEARHESDS